MKKVFFSLLAITLSIVSLEKSLKADEVCFFSRGRNGDIQIVAGKSAIPKGVNIKSYCLQRGFLEKQLYLNKKALLTINFDKNGSLVVQLQADKSIKDLAKTKKHALPIKTVLETVGGRKNLASPEDIELTGSQRKVQLSTSLGTINLRWPRSVEKLFGRTPERAVLEAANYVKRTLNSASFPGYIKHLNLDWNIVFMDENLPEEQIPARLIQNCHPGWMQTPANIYIVAQRVARGCNSNRNVIKNISDSKLAELLVHEMGHVVDYQLVRKQTQGQHIRKEGFATWFELFVAKRLGLSNYNDKQKENILLAKHSIEKSPDRFIFNGSSEDYARASLYFQVIIATRGVPGLIRIYDKMFTGLDFLSAIKKEFSWNDKRLNDEINNLLEK